MFYRYKLKSFFPCCISINADDFLHVVKADGGELSEEDKRIAMLGAPVLGQLTKLEVAVVESEEFKVSSSL